MKNVNFTSDDDKNKEILLEKEKEDFLIQQQKAPVFAKLNNEYMDIFKAGMVDCQLKRFCSCIYNIAKDRILDEDKQFIILHYINCSFNEFVESAISDFNYNYPEYTAILKEMRSLYEKMGRVEDYEDYLNEINNEKYTLTQMKEHLEELKDKCEEYKKEKARDWYNDMKLDEQLERESESLNDL